MTGKTTTVEVEPESTILDLKVKFQEAQNHNPNEINLCLSKGEDLYLLLSHDKTLSFYNLENESTVTIFFKFSEKTNIQVWLDDAKQAIF